MKKMKSKSLSVFIVVCLLLTSLFNTVFALPQEEGSLDTEITNEHDGHSHVDPESIKEEIRVESTTEESLRVIEDPMDPPIDPPTSDCNYHTWIYSNGSGNHMKQCTYCNYVVYEAHDIYYSNLVSHHEKRCSKCTYSEWEDHVADLFGTYIANGDAGHYTNCKICSGYTKIQPHDFFIEDSPLEYHYLTCKKCSHSIKEDCKGDGTLIGSDPNKWDFCAKCSGIIEVGCSHSSKVYNPKTDNAHEIACYWCNQTLGYESHTWDSTHQECTKCGLEVSCQHDNTTAVNTNDNFYHRLECNDCDQSNIGNETHDWKLTYILPTLPGLEPVKQYICIKCDYKLSPGATPR